MKKKNEDDSSIFHLPQLWEGLLKLGMLSKVVGDGGVCWDLCSTGVVALGRTLLPGAELRGLTWDCPGEVFHAWFREKRIQTMMQNSFTLRYVISPLCCSLLKAKSRLHRLNLVHAKKGPVLTLPHIPA